MVIKYVKDIDDKFMSDFSALELSADVTEIDWLKTNYGREYQEISTAEILWNGKHNKFITVNGGANCACCDGKRFREANYNDYPIWIIEHNCVKGEKYIVMDGKHRLNKAIADGKTTIKAYVYTQAQLESYVSSKE